MRELFPNAQFKIDITGLPEIFGNGGDSSISHLDNGAGNKCCELWKACGAQGWGSEV